MSRRPDRPGGIPSPVYPAPRRPQPLKALRRSLRALDPRDFDVRDLDPRRLSLRTMAVVLMATGALIAVVPVAIVGYGMWQESQLTQQWTQAARPETASDVDRSQVLPPFATPEPTAPPVAATSRPTIPALFAIRVPKIGYYAAVRQGVSLDVLAVGPGHYPTTALPGQPGLVGVAAHNTFWIPFGQLGPGDTVILETLTAKFTYHITGTKIVNPDDHTVLAGTSDARLVLTTCWPLWAGNLAPQRLALFAQQV